MFIFKKNKKKLNLEKSSNCRYTQHILDDINAFIRIVDKNDNCYTSSIISLEANTLIFSAPIKHRTFVNLNVKDNLDVYFVTQNKIFFSSLQLEEHVHSEASSQYIGKLLVPITAKEQRRFFRLELTLDVDCELIYTPTIVPKLHENKKFKAHTVNISAGGMLLSSPIQLPKDSIVSITFELENNTFNLKLRTLKEGFNNASSNFYHPSQFIEIAPNTTNTISQLIMKKQVQMLNTEKVL